MNRRVNMFNNVVDGIMKDVKVTSLKFFKPPFDLRIPTY